MTNDKRDDIGLEAYFDAGRADAMQPSGGLMARILADAEAQMADIVPPVQSPGPSLLATLWAAIGGWPAAAGMATATVAGVWIGFSQPAGLDLVTDSYLGLEGDSYLVDVMPAFGDDFGEG